MLAPKQSVYFIIEDKPYLVKDQVIIQESELYNRLISTCEKERLDVVLPKWVKAQSYEILLQINSKLFTISHADIPTIRNALGLADFLQIESSQKAIIEMLVVPSLSVDSILLFLKDSYEKVHKLRLEYEESGCDNQSITKIYEDLFSKCFTKAEENSIYLFERQYDELLSLNAKIADELAMSLLKTHGFNPLFDSTNVIRFLLEMREIKSVFNFYKEEKEKLLHEEVNKTKKGAKPTLTWRINDVGMSFYRTSDPFVVDNLSWILSCWCMNNETSITVAINNHTKPDTQNTENSNDASYFNKKHYFLKKKILKKSNSENPENSLISEEFNRCPKNSILCLSAWAAIESHTKEITPKLVHLLAGFNTAKTVVKLPFFLKGIEELGIQIYFKLQPLLSCLLTYISRYFYLVYSDPSIALLEKDDLVFLLKHKHINVNCEDEVLYAIDLWAKNKDNKDIVEVLKCVKWAFISPKALLSLAKKSNLKKISYFKDTLKGQKDKRSQKQDPTMPGELNPRKCYRFLPREGDMHISEETIMLLMNGNTNSDEEVNLDETVVANNIIAEDINLNAESTKTTSKYFGNTSSPQVHSKELPTVATSEDSISTVSKRTKEEKEDDTDTLLKKLMDMADISESTDFKSNSMLHEFVSISNSIRIPEHKTKNKAMSKTAMSISVQPSPTAFKSSMKSTFSTKSSGKPTLRKNSPGNRSNYDSNYDSVTSTQTLNENLSYCPAVKIPKKQDYLKTYKLQNNPLKMLKRFEVSAKHKRDCV